MVAYNKPLALAAEDYAEAIFAASGDSGAAGTSDRYNSAISYSLKLTNAWDGNKQYDITVTNDTDAKVEAVTIEVPFTGDVTYVGGNWTSASLGDGVVSLTFNNWGNGIEAGASVSVYTQVSGTGDFALN